MLHTIYEYNLRWTEELKIRKLLNALYTRHRKYLWYWVEQSFLTQDRRIKKEKLINYISSKFKTPVLWKILLRKLKGKPQTVRKENLYKTHIWLKKMNFFSEYIKNSQNSLIRKQTTQKEMSILWVYTSPNNRQDGK